MDQAAENMTATVRVRMTPTQKARLIEDAATAKSELSDLARAILLNRPIPRKRRASSADEKQLARILMALGPIGNNANQLAKVANTERTISIAAVKATRELAAEIAALREDLRHALRP